MITFSRTIIRGIRKAGPLPSKHGNKDYYKGLHHCHLVSVLNIFSKETGLVLLVDTPIMVKILFG